MTGDVMFHEFIKKPEENEEKKLPDDQEPKIDKKKIKKDQPTASKSS